MAQCPAKTTIDCLNCQGAPRYCCCSPQTICELMKTNLKKPVWRSVTCKYEHVLPLLHCLIPAAPQHSAKTTFDTQMHSQLFPRTPQSRTLLLRYLATATGVLKRREEECCKATPVTSYCIDPQFLLNSASRSHADDCTCASRSSSAEASQSFALRCHGAQQLPLARRAFVRCTIQNRADAAPASPCMEDDLPDCPDARECPRS